MQARVRTPSLAVSIELSPLNEYPDNYAVQHFGCSLAMHVGEREATGKACRGAIDLAGAQ
ncbi:MAG: hypothetical protein WBM48_07530 [Polyangiales bacterium]|jgi:hypothetical protein